MSPKSKPSTLEKPQGKQLPPKTCKLCKGAGCCNLCDNDWEGMIHCSNKAVREHWVHYSCDNLTPEMRRAMYKYYCPACRLDNFQITFKRDTSSANRQEIKNILYTSQSNKPVDMASEAINMDSRALNVNLENQIELESGVFNQNLQTEPESYSPEKHPTKSDESDSHPEKNSEALNGNLEYQEEPEAYNSENHPKNSDNSDLNLNKNKIVIELNSGISTKNIATHLSSIPLQSPLNNPGKKETEDNKLVTDKILSEQDEITKDEAKLITENDQDSDQGFPRDFLVGGHFFSKVPPLGGALFSQGGGAVGGH